MPRAVCRVSVPPHVVLLHRGPVVAGVRGALEMVSWREREARNEARFRTQNEWVVTTGLEDESLLGFVCECGDGECGRTIRLTTAEYEFVRATSNRFAIAPNHENPECEVVITEGARYAVIDKIEGWGLRISRETDPRSSSGSHAGKPA